MSLQAYEVWVDGFREHASEVNHFTLEGAAAFYVRSLQGRWPELSLDSIRGRWLGDAWTSQRLAHVTSMLGVSHIKAGVPLVIGNRRGWLADADECSNLVVLMDDGGTMILSPNAIDLSACVS